MYGIKHVKRVLLTYSVSVLSKNTDDDYWLYKIQSLVFDIIIFNVFRRFFHSFQSSL